MARKEKTTRKKRNGGDGEKNWFQKLFSSSKPNDQKIIPNIVSVDDSEEQFYKDNNCDDVLQLENIQKIQKCKSIRDRKSRKNTLFNAKNKILIMQNPT